MIAAIFARRSSAAQEADKRPKRPLEDLSDADIQQRALSVSSDREACVTEALFRTRDALQDFNKKTGRQTTWLLRLTWAIAILTLIMAAGLGWQIYLALGIPE